MLLEERCGIDSGIKVGINPENITTADIGTYGADQGRQTAILATFPVD